MAWFLYDVNRDGWRQRRRKRFCWRWRTASFDLTYVKYGEQEGDEDNVERLAEVMSTGHCKRPRPVSLDRPFTIDQLYKAAAGVRKRVDRDERKL
jgi:hypothetical protein